MVSLFEAFKNSEMDSGEFSFKMKWKFLSVFDFDIRAMESVEVKFLDLSSEEEVPFIVDMMYSIN